MLISFRSSLSATISELDRRVMFLIGVSFFFFFFVILRAALTSYSTISIEFDGFVPPTTERHHQLLLPALQLVVGTLVSFGAETALANRQVRSPAPALCIAFND